MSDAYSILIVKTGALGDVLRTTALLPGLLKRYPGAHITWVVAAGAAPLLEGWPGVVEPCVLDFDDSEATIEALKMRSYQLVISLDEEEVCCRVASSVNADSLVGAFISDGGAVEYTPEAQDWFDMSLISRFGRERADQLKVENLRTHPELLSSMVGVDEGKPHLPLPESAERHAGHLFDSTALAGVERVIGLNTGSGARWPSKQVDVERTIETAVSLARSVGEGIGFVVLGGREEQARNAQILEGLQAQGVVAVGGGSENSLHQFAAIVNRCQLVISSDSLCLHIAIARSVPVVAFFAPTSAPEIELYGLGEKVVSTAPDQCSYRPDTDNSTITPARLVEAALKALDMSREQDKQS